MSVHCFICHLTVTTCSSTLVRCSCVMHLTTLNWHPSDPFLKRTFIMINVKGCFRYCCARRRIVCSDDACCQASIRKGIGTSVVDGQNMRARLCTCMWLQHLTKCSASSSSHFHVVTRGCGLYDDSGHAVHCNALYYHDSARPCVAALAVSERCRFRNGQSTA